MRPLPREVMLALLRDVQGTLSDRTHEAVTSLVESPGRKRRFSRRICARRFPDMRITPHALCGF